MDAPELRAMLKKELEKNIHAVITMLQYVGEKVVNGVRDESLSNWKDRTGNLRSSVGYVVSVDGKPLNFYGFQQVDGPLRGTKEDPGYNPETQKEYARTLCSLYPEGIALIIVAGMEYAYYVERLENKTVLAQGEIEGKKLINEMIQKLNARRKK